MWLWGKRVELNLNVRQRGVSLSDGESTALLAVANGLSVPRQQWPDFFPPGEVEDHDPPEVIEPLPAYWYVD